MAERPIFAPMLEGPIAVDEISLRLAWNPGFSVAQKKKNIDNLHAAARMAGFSPILEVSTKSDEILGQHLSAFHLTVRGPEYVEIRLESAFQGSKVFANGGPYNDLYCREAREAKRDPRLQSSGPLTGFIFAGLRFPLEPRTVFYDWLYLNAIYPHRKWLERLDRFAAFSDIEFNPHRSINCQARSCALFVSLKNRGLLDQAMQSPTHFITLISGFTHRKPCRPPGSVLPDLFAE